jgi:hypothetical protein
MSSEIRPEDIEAAIAAAEQRRRARMGGAAMAGAADLATAPAPGAGRRSVLPERSVAGAAAAAADPAPAREAGKPAASQPMSDDLDDSWLDQPARPRPSISRVANLPESEVVWEPETTRRGLALPFAIAAIALLVFGAILWWAYSSDPEQGGGEVPVIVAEDTPIKEKPAEEGGLEVPDQDKLVYDNIAEGEQPDGQVEQLLPAPEEPVAPPQPEPAVTAAAEPTPLPSSAEETDAALADAASTAPAAPEPVQPQAAASGASAPAAPAAAAPAAAAPATGAEAAAPAPAAEPAAPAATQQAAAPAAAAPAEPVQPAAGAGWKIQLAAVKSEQAARQEWGRMQKAHPDMLGDMRLTVQRADLGDKGVFFRIQAGPLPDRTTAEDVCAELKASKQPCLVVKP